jgi:hypothetical protein
MELSALNIVLKQHSDENYIYLIEQAFKYNSPIKIFGQYHAIPSYLEINKEKGYIFGKFYRFTDINQKQAWIDTKKVTEIRDDEGNPIPQVSETLKPNSKEIYFVFITKHHRLVFDKKYIAPSSMKSFFTNLFNEASIKHISKQEITITIEQSAESLDEILKIKHISEIEFEINRPNPDDISGLEDDVKKRLTNMNADKLSQQIKSKEANIKPDDDFVKMMKVAISNGLVQAKGLNNAGKRVFESTLSHPLKVLKTYDIAQMSYFDALKKHAEMIVEDIIERMKA